MTRRGRPAKGRKITSGGITQLGAERQRLDIVLQSPEVFHFDIASFMSSYLSASAVDTYNRSRLYDIYASVLMDTHLTGVINKRMAGVRRMRVEFRRDSVPDDTVNERLRGPWFRRLTSDILWSKFWGFSLMQFYTAPDGGIGYDLIDRKHYDPVRREILRYETDSTGIPVDQFADVLCVSEGDRDLGLLSRITPMVLYKRGNIGDWAQFCQVFGMPVREYTYDAGDEEARLKLLQDARRQGGNAVYIHPSDTTLRLVESGAKSGTVDLYERFTNMCNTEISVAVLGNTLTTDAKSTGTQALGTVHQQEEERLKEEDRDFVLDVLNYDMTGIFASLGIDTSGGRFEYVEEKKVDKTEQIAVVEKLHNMGLPLSDDYLYSTFDIDKPEDYDTRKAEAERRRTEALERLSNTVQSEDGGPSDRTLVNRLRGFFGLAPRGGAHRPLDF